MLAFGESITRLRAPLAPSAYNPAATQRDWAAATRTRLPAGFGIDPGTSVETDTVNRQQITTTPTLIWMGASPPDVTYADRVQQAGVTWEVIGHRSDYRHPMTGWVAGSTWPLQRSEG